MRTASFALLFLLFAGSVAAQQPDSAPQPAKLAAPADLSDPRLAKLPPELRQQGFELLSERDDDRRESLAEALGKKSPIEAMNFLLAVLETDPSSKVKEEIVGRLGGYPHPQVRQALERHASSDPDVPIAILALEKLRAQQIQSLLHLLARRMDLARREEHGEDYRTLVQERQRWVSLLRGAMLPTFLQVPPALFSVKDADQPVRVLAFGDFGNGGAEQRRAARAMLLFHEESPFDFAITLGDNFYSKGMESPTDARWRTWYEELYSPLGIPFYATLGNHDWGLPDSPAAEVLYAAKSPSWRMPATRYTFTAGPVQFFALDTNGMSEAQLIWLEEELKKSTARWKVVYGHHPIYSDGAHEDNVNMIDDLLPVVRNRADIYLAGHDHDLQHLQPEAGVHFFIAGGGGAKIRPVHKGPRGLFAKSSYGFAVLEADSNTLKVRFVNSDLNQLYEYTLTK